MDTVGIEIVDRVLTRYTGTEAKVVVDSDILTIADNAFAHNEHIESIEVKSLSLRTVGNEAFSGCKRLCEAHFNAIKGGIGASAFEGCSRLSSFMIPNGAMEIGSRAFCGCAAHFVLQVPASVDVIGDKIVDRSAIIVSLKPNDEINRYVEKNNIAVRRDFNAVLKHLGTRELIERHGGDKKFTICGETISASNTLRIYQEVLEYYENEKQRLVDLAIDGLPTQLSLSAAQQKAITDVLNSLQDGTKALISRVERWGVILPDSTAFPDALLPMVKLAKCANLIIQGLTEGKKAANEMIEEARSALVDEAESRVTGLSYGMIGGGLDMVLYSIDDFRERQRQRRAAYAEADVKLQQYASKTNNLANQQFAALMKDTAIPTFLATIAECCEALRAAELDTLRGEGILLGNEPELDDIAKSAKIIESALSDTSRDKEYSIALALKKCPFNKGAYSLAAGNGLVSDGLFALAAHIGMGDEILENISPEFSLVEKMAQSKAVTIDGLAEFCSNVTIFGGKMPDRVAAIIKNKLINLLKAHVRADLNTQYDGHNQKAIEECAVKSAVACVSKKTSTKLNNAGISVIDCASLIAKEKIQEDRSDLYALTQAFINESQSIPESIARIKANEATLGNSSTIELIQACITCCDKKLVSLADDYASRDIQPDAGELEDRVLGIIGDSELDYIRSKGCSVLRNSPKSIKELTEILLKRIESTRIKNAADERKYVEACRLQEAAQSAKDYAAVAALFDELTLYKDSTARQIECIKKQQEIQEKEYADAADALKSAKTRKALDEVSMQFAAISDYKDSKNQLTEIENRKKSIKNRKIGFIIGIVGVVLIAAIVYYSAIIVPGNKYKAAEALLESGQYEEAIEAFEALGSYKDSAQQVQTAKLEMQEDYLAANYEEAKRLLSEGDYAAAIDAFKELGEFRDSPAQMETAISAKIETENSAKYEEAMHFAEHGDYYNAFVLFSELNGYKDANEMAVSLKNQHPFACAEIEDTVFFGTYEQDNNPNNGQEPIEWIVIGRSDNEITLYSKYCLDIHEHSPQTTALGRSECEWIDSPLFKWLNNDFCFIAFNMEESATLTGPVSLLNESAAETLPEEAKPLLLTEYTRGIASDIDNVWLAAPVRWKSYYQESSNLSHIGRFQSGALRYSDNKSPNIWGSGVDVEDVLGGIRVLITINSSYDS